MNRGPLLRNGRGAGRYTPNGVMTCAQFTAILTGCFTGLCAQLLVCRMERIGKKG